MAYDNHIELNSDDIELLEKCLRRELGTVTSRVKNDRQPKHKDAMSELDLIHTLLGKLQNHKPSHDGTPIVVAA